MEKQVSDMGRRGFDRMRSPRAATIIALASATGHARTLQGRQGGVTIPLAPRTARAIDLVISERTEGPLCSAQPAGHHVLTRGRSSAPR